MITFDEMIREAARYLEANMRCGKHHVEHTGNSTYLLDMYSYLGEIEKGKLLLAILMQRVMKDGEQWIFYPGLLNARNMSNNVIDCGSCVDTIARFLHTHADAFTEAEHAQYNETLKKVVETYLKSTTDSKPLTNQRLWGLTGIASYAAYGGDTSVWERDVQKSIEQAFADMTADGFFRYYPDAEKHGTFAGYDGMTTFYQSRCSAFIRYSLSEMGMPAMPHEDHLMRSEQALLAMYMPDGTKDLRMECKRWYWQSTYEVASHAFDAYALSHSNVPEAKIALHNVLYQIRRHFFDGSLHSHIGAPVNFQCPIFWTAHVAWLTRIPNIKELFDAADSLQPFSFELKGKEVYAKTTPRDRVLINTLLTPRNLTTGITQNGLSGKVYWKWHFPSLPPKFLFSVRETLNHSWYALSGGHIREACVRLFYFKLNCIVMLLPRYTSGYGAIRSLEYENGHARVEVQPASKYGTVLETSKTIII